MDNEITIRGLLRVARQITLEELGTTDIMAVLTVFERNFPEHDQGRFSTELLGDLARH